MNIRCFFHYVRYSKLKNIPHTQIITMSGAPTAKWAVHDRESIRNSSLHVAYLLGCANESDFDDTGSGDGENGTAVEDEDVTVRQEKIDQKIIQCMKLADPAEIVMKSYSVSKLDCEILCKVYFFIDSKFLILKEYIQTKFHPIFLIKTI